MQTSTTAVTSKQSTVQLTDRDMEILRFVQSGSAKTSIEIEQKFWNEKSRKAHAGFQRIRKLLNAGYLERGNPRILYVTTKAGEMLSKVPGVVEPKLP